ncbi:hypothetical protein BT63DRAFT_452387 [Microthyrium microscopicum]|uniref:Uncharacterized protein n=1 Tax=Microthyrium microscopicum TaxID=703497 RepID=A0A6A6UK84_9PEZI|nr:hypothetical protein BT63DRAFT_452387 [Microthyrium microscopicum]
MASNMMATNISAICSNISTINDLLNNAQFSHQNITQTVSLCPGICSQEWGLGNPDLSGVGANISYIMQAVLTFILGAPFCALYIFLLEKRAAPRKLLEDLETIQDAFLDINAQFSIPVAIAAIVRLHQGASLYEIAFLESLLTMQFLSVLATSLTLLARNDFIASKKRTAVVVIYVMAEFVFLMALAGTLSTSQSKVEALHDLVAACKPYSPLKPGFVHITPVNVPHISAKQYFSFKTKDWKQTMKAVWTVIGLVLAAFVALCLAGAILFGMVQKLQESKRRMMWHAVVSIGLFAGIIYNTTQMEIKRHALRELVGMDFMDNQWGFGQVVAVFLWVPFLVQAFWILFGYPFKYTTVLVANDSGSLSEHTRKVVERGSTHGAPSAGDVENTVDSRTDDNGPIASDKPEPSSAIEETTRGDEIIDTSAKD